ncbi:TSC22 domain family protein 1 [Puntigrus tetrazona]|uniref:TSC22 domain family protein 1 n=1 Tax=Puntigrus tetrazona TaxID=1606681 RepID=UPI001C8A0AD2|nr:TSC22 domain family protein 1 [Puntigrus tetrazona]
MAHPPPAGSSSPGPHSLGIPTVKKKSGFQITSVLPAQVSSASANNSIADDTESYDDMDESHTEDLSSSDILDVSVSRATDTGVPERSSSEETLNSLHGGETPGVASPNEPVMHPGYMVNGVHHHPHHQKTGRSVAPSAPPSAIPSAIPAVPQAPAPSARAVPAEAGGSASSSASAATDSAALPSASANPSATASRFRVVKLDSNSEPFRKGRWTCTEFYEKDGPPGDAASAAHRAVESVIQSEHESTSGSSSGSTLSGGGGDVQQGFAPDAGAHLLPPAESSPAPGRPYAPLEYAQIPANVQPLQIPPIPSAVSPRAAPVSIGLLGPVSPRPLQVGIAPDQAGAQLSSSSAQAELPPLRAPLHLTGPAYVTASQLEDAQRLLLQHHTLLSLAAGGRAGPSVSASALGQDGAAGAFVVSTGADEDSSSGASVVAIDNKIEQAMDLVKSHLMYAVREEVEVLKEQIKELMERNSQLEQENALLKNLASPEQLAQFQAQVQTGSPTAGAPNPGPGPTA